MCRAELMNIKKNKNLLPCMLKNLRTKTKSVRANDVKMICGSRCFTSESGIICINNNSQIMSRDNGELS